MDRWKLWFALLLLLTYSVDNKGTGEVHVKTIGKEPDATQICTNQTLNVIVMIICKISTERSGGEQCSLLYRHGQDFEHKCDSRFTLMKENQTVFLHLVNLTAKDSGNYNCECVHHGGSYKLQLNVTVEVHEGHKDHTPVKKPHFYYTVPVLIIISGVIVGLIHRKKCHGRRQQVPITSHGNTELYTEAEDIEPYSVFMQMENGLYLTSKLNTNYSTENMSYANLEVNLQSFYDTAYTSM